MKTSQLIYSDNKWNYSSDNEISDPDLVLVFGTTQYIKDCAYKDLKRLFPSSHILGCSTAGSIAGEQVDDFNTATLVSFEKSSIKVISKDFNNSEESREIGENIGKSFELENLKHIFLLSDGLAINGSELTNGLNKVIPDSVHVTGGLAGDGARFEETYVIADDEACTNRIVAIGFYGQELSISSGCFAGWDEFGAERYITKSKGNILYEIDGKPALELYKSYLVDETKDLPASGLKFPISIRSSKDDKSVIRTLLGINEDENSLVFAGDVPEGYYCRLMKSNIDGLIENAGLAAKSAQEKNKTSELCIAVSCVGRRIVLSQLVEEETEAVLEELSSQVTLTGFYSYGEVAPLEGLNSCSLHNQTMTLTVISEKI